MAATLHTQCFGVELQHPRLDTLCFALHVAAVIIRLASAVGEVQPQFFQVSQKQLQKTLASGVICQKKSHEVLMDRNTLCELTVDNSQQH